MTTIAVNLERMSADSRCTTGDQCFSSKKVFRVGQDVIGAAGYADDCERFIEWYKNKNGPLALGKPDEFAAIALTRGGIYLYSGEGLPTHVDDGFYAIGSGGMAALGAMHMGATPEEAVRIAGIINPETGGKTYTIKLVADAPDKRARRK